MDNDILGELESEVGYRFGNRSLLLESLTHRSFSNEAGGEVGDNERLEFFGDAVLAFCISRELLDRFPHWREGALTKARGALVDEKTLAALAAEIGLGRYLRLGKGEERSSGRGKRSILADALEALLAAISLDGGIEAAQRFVRVRFSPLMDDLHFRVAGRDAKTELQELAQSGFGATPQYRMLQVAGPDHARIFTTAVLLGETELGTGSGGSKKESEQKAAGEGLAALREMLHGRRGERQ